MYKMLNKEINNNTHCPKLKTYVPDFCYYSLFTNLIFSFQNCEPESKNISATWSRTYTALLFQNWEHVPGAETYVPCVPEIENSFLQISFVSGFLKGNLAIGRTETEQSP